MQRRSLRILLAMIGLLFTMGTVALAADTPRISIDELKARMGEEHLVIIDARANWDWLRSQEKIVGAVRVEPHASTDWARAYPPEATLVLYCA